MKAGRMALGLLAALAAPLAAGAQGTTTLIATGATWSYLDDGSDQGMAWREPGFIESWATGLAELGFGDGDEATPLGNNGVTFYFRHEFQLDASELGEIQALRLWMRRDDGIIVYINGQEVYRLGLRSGAAFDQTSRATGSETLYYPWVLGPESLVEGMNLVAVEIHNVSVGGNDISFDLELIASPGDALIWRGPYLQIGAPDSATLRFLTDAAVAPTVRYGSSPGTLDSSVV
ncbi:MAG: hypothetical protein V3T24_01265, partial [Longimicrobiales bacterium]